MTNETPKHELLIDKDSYKAYLIAELGLLTGMTAPRDSDNREYKVSLPYDYRLTVSNPTGLCSYKLKNVTITITGEVE